MSLLIITIGVILIVLEISDISATLRRIERKINKKEYRMERKTVDKDRVRG